MRSFAIIGVLVTVGNAAANPEAETRFREGRRLLKLRLLPEACAELERSQQLEPMPGTLLSLADCQEQRGQAASARATFLQAKALARELGDRRREVEADRRVAALARQLARLTLVVPRDRAVGGYAIRRNGAVVDAATWNTAVALDPGDYRIEVTAPGFRSWSTTERLEARQQASLVVEALVAEPASMAIASTAPAASVREVNAPLGGLAVGALIGTNVQHESAVFGARVVVAMAAPAGQVRGVASLYFSRYRDEPEVNPSFKTDTYSAGVSGEYLWMPRPSLALGGGLGIGADYDVVNAKTADRTNDVGMFVALRASPIVVRMREGAVEAGLHVAVVIAGDEVVVNAVAAVDWFVW